MKLCILLLDEFFGVFDFGIWGDMYELILKFWCDIGIIIFMVIYDLYEGFYLGIWLLVFDKVWNDLQNLEVYGVIIFYDLFIGWMDFELYQIIELLVFEIFCKLLV